MLWIGADAQSYVGDGVSFSAETYSPSETPLYGPNYTIQGYDNFASASLNSSLSVYYSGLVVAGNLWMSPSGLHATPITKVSTTTGLMSSYTSTVFGTGYCGAVWDGAKLWFVPNKAIQVLKVDPVSGIGVAFTQFPDDSMELLGQAAGFIGGTYDSVGKNIWMTPYFAKLVTYVDTNTGTMTAVNVTKWPAGPTKNRRLLGATLETASQRVHWMFPKEGPYVIGVNTQDPSAAMLTLTLPTLSCGSSYKFLSGIYTQNNSVWAIPGQCRDMVHMDTATGVGTAHNNWPAAFTPNFGTDLLFQGGIWDGRYIWMASKVSSNLAIIRFDASDESGTLGAMMMLSQFPSGFNCSAGNAFVGVGFDPSVQTIFFIPQACSMVIKLTSSGIATVTEGATPTWNLQVHDGISASSEKYAAMPMSGLDIQMTAFDNWASASITKTTSIEYYGGVIVGDHLWMVPVSSSADPTKVHKHTGEMEKYTDYPTSFVGGSLPFTGSAFDGTNVWLVPYTSNQLVRIDPTTGAMTGLPHGDTNGYFIGASVDNSNRLWLTPRPRKVVLRVDTPSGEMTKFTAFPLGFIWTSSALCGAAFDGVTHWMAPSQQKWMVGVNTGTGDMRGIDGANWPASIKLKISFNNFGALVSTERNLLFFAPCFAEAVVQLDTRTEVAAPLQDWPVEWSSSATIGSKCLFYSIAFDGQYLWLPPYDGHASLLRVDTKSRSMLAFSKLWPSNAALGGQQIFVGMILDPTAQSFWIVPRKANTVIRLKVSEITQEQTPTWNLQVHDGISASTEKYAAMPMSGIDFVMTAFDNWASASISKATNEFYGGVIVGDYIWMVPITNNAYPTRVHKTTGEMSKYTEWPINGFSLGTHPFAGCAFDGAFIWLVPLTSNRVVRLDPATGGMTGYSHGLGGTHYCLAASIDRWNRVWMSPYRQSTVLRVETPSGSVAKFSTYPKGFAWSDVALLGAAYDGKSHWMAPYRKKWVVGVNTETGDMTGFNGGTDWPSSVGFQAERNFLGIVSTRGSDLYLAPFSAAAIVHLDSASGIAKAHNNWPADFVSAVSFGSTRLFASMAFDGQYLWMPPVRHRFLIRFDTVSNTMLGLDRLWPASVTNIESAEYSAFIGTIFEPASQSLWFVPRHASAVVRLTVKSLTQVPESDASSLSSSSPSSSSSSSSSSDSQSESSSSSGNSIASIRSGVSSNNIGSSGSSSSLSPAGGHSSSTADTSSKNSGIDTESPPSLHSSDASPSSAPLHSSAPQVGSQSSGGSGSFVPVSLLSSASPSQVVSTSLSSSSSGLTLTVKEEEDRSTTLNSATASAVSTALGNKEAAVAIVGTGTASAAVGSFASPTAASQAVRVGMVAGVVECAYSENNVEPSLLEHPIQFHLFGSDAFAKLTGSILATTLVFILLPSLAIVLHLAVSNHTEDTPLPKWRLALQGKILGTLLAIGLGYFAPSVVEATLLILTHGQNPGQKAVAVICLLVCVAPLVGGTVIMTRRFDDLVEVKSKKDKKKDRMKFNYSNHGPKLWAQAIGPFMDGTRDPMRLATRLYFIEEIGITLLLGILSGIKPSGEGQCTPLAVCMVIVCVVHCVYLAVFRPYIAKLELFFVVTTGVLLLAMTGIALAATLTPNPSDSLMKALGYVALTESIIFFAQAAVLGFWAYTVSERRKVKEREAAAAAVLAPVSVTTATSPPQGAASASTTTPPPSTRPPKSASTPGAGGGNSAPLLQPPVRDLDDEGAGGAPVNPLQKQRRNPLNRV